MKTALIIIDLQNDFLEEGGAYARGGCTNPEALALPARVLEVAQAIKKKGGLVVASQFTLWPDTAGQPLISPHLKSSRPKRCCACVPAAGIKPDDKLVEPLGVGSRSITTLSVWCCARLKAVAKPQAPAPIITTGV